MTQHDQSHPGEHDLQPSSRMCFGCGIENVAGLQIRFYNDGQGKSRADVSLSDKHQGFPGIAHGGITATMLDEIMGRAAMTGNFMRLLYTAKMEVKYRKPVPLHTPLILTGRVEKDRGMIVYTVGEVRLPDGTLLAESTAVLMEIPREELEKMNTDAVGWKVYPLE